MAKKGVIIYFDEDILEELDIIAREFDRSRSDLVRDAVKELLNKPKYRQILDRRLGCEAEDCD